MVSWEYNLKCLSAKNVDFINIVAVYGIVCNVTIIKRKDVLILVP